jgi:hypothetical protein
VESLTYLGSIVDKQGGTDANVKIRVNIARAAFLQLKEVWTFRVSTNTKIRLFNSNVKSILLYGAETCEYHKENPEIHQQLSENDSPNTLA